MIEVTLPYPPTINHLWGRKHSVVRGKVYCQTYVKKEGQLFHEHAAWLFRAQGLRETLTCKIRLEVDVYPPDNRVRDLDNVAKILCDCLQKSLVIGNDSQIHCILLTKCAVEKPKGKVIIRISELIEMIVR